MLIDTSQEITNIEIMNVAQRFGINNKLLNIIMKDEAHMIKKNQYYIINLDKSNGRGTHWTALICNKSTCMYIDSYGTPPPQKILMKLKKMYNNQVYFSDFIAQDLKSVACGYFALSYIITYHIYRHQYSLLQIASKYIDYFDDDTTKNDNLVAKLFTKF